MICNQAVIAIQNARLFQDLTAEKDAHRPVTGRSPEKAGPRPARWPHPIGLGHRHAREHRAQDVGTATRIRGQRTGEDRRPGAAHHPGNPPHAVHPATAGAGKRRAGRRAERHGGEDARPLPAERGPRGGSGSGRGAGRLAPNRGLLPRPKKPSTTRASTPRPSRITVRLQFITNDQQPGRPGDRATTARVSTSTRCWAITKNAAAWGWSTCASAPT